MFPKISQESKQSWHLQTFVLQISDAPKHGKSQGKESAAGFLSREENSEL